MQIDIEDVKTLTLKDNQTLVVKIAGIPKRDDRIGLKQALECCFPNNQVIVIDSSIELSVIEDCTDAR